MVNNGATENGVTENGVTENGVTENGVTEKIVEPSTQTWVQALTPVNKIGFFVSRWGPSRTDRQKKNESTAQNSIQKPSYIKSTI